MNVVAWVVVGLIAGALARLLVPGRDPMGLLWTLVLGLVGSILGGLVVEAITARDREFTPAGLIGSILGAVVILIGYRTLARQDA